MDIFTPNEIENPVFDDYLEQVDKTRKGEETRATLGRPEWWFISDIFDDKWKPPQGDDTYLLIRLSCSIEPPKNQEVQNITLTANLFCRSITRQPVAFELFPREVKEETETDVTVSISPELKIGKIFSPGLMVDKVEGALGEVGGTIHFSKMEPVIIASRIGQSDPTWVFRRHRRHPLVGSRTVYMIVAYPSIAPNMRLSLKLISTTSSRFGPIRFQIPESAEDRLSWVIP